MDELLKGLRETRVGCHFGPYFTGAVCYADDIALLAPSPSALCHLLTYTVNSFHMSLALPIKFVLVGLSSICLLVIFPPSVKY